MATLDSSDQFMVERAGKLHSIPASDVKYPDAKMALIGRAGLGTLNPNPTFVLGVSDYETWLSISSRYDVVEDVVDNTAGSLHLITQNYPPTMNSDSFYPVNVKREYRASISTLLKMTGDGVDPNKEYSSLFYYGVTCYDSDKTPISPQHLTKWGESQTYLAAPLKNGDPTITVEDASAWYTGAYVHRRSILMHRKRSNGTYSYNGANGRIYDNLGMSKWNMYYAYNEGSDKVVDNGNGTWTITLKTPWALGDFVVGDAIRNNYGGGTYNYWISSLRIMANPAFDAFTRYASPWGLNTTDQYNYASKFRNGTAFVKAMALLNYLVYEKSAGGGWVNLGHNTNTIVREQWFPELSLEWRHIP